MKTSPSNQLALAQALHTAKPFSDGDNIREKITTLIGEIVCTDLQPIFIVEDRGSREFIEHLEPRHPIKSKKFLANIQIVPQRAFKNEIGRRVTRIRFLGFCC